MSQRDEPMDLQTQVEGGRPYQGREHYRTPQRTFRIPDDLYTAAQTKAEGEGETVTDVIRRALEGYVAPAVAVDPRDPR